MIKTLQTLTSKGKPKTPIVTIAAGAERVTKSLTDKELKKRMKRIDADFQQAFKLLRKHPDTVTFFGSSASLPETDRYYKMARELAARIVTELHLTVVSGGGPGIMEAGNRGAREAHGDSVGMTIEIPTEHVNTYVTHSADFYYFFSRKVALTFTSRAYVYFPGGYGTLDELFEILTLQKTGKIPAIPIVLIGSEYWNSLHHFLKDVVWKKMGMIGKEHLELYTITDDLDEVLRLIAGRTK